MRAFSSPRLSLASLFFSLAIACGMPCVAADGTAIAADEAPLPLIPMPAHVERLPGDFVLHDGARLIVNSGDPRALDIARHFDKLLTDTRGMHLDMHGPAGAGITFELDAGDATLPGGEGYRLQINAQGIRIAAQEPAGLFYGGVTLWQLLTPDASRGPSVELPAVTIEDSPRFPWRGLMMDSARHFQSVPDIERLIDWMALHKLNVLQWHLTDDQGWRLEIKRYPKLTSIGACRRSVGPDAALTGGADKPYCGFYTQAQAREVVRYAARRFVTVVPEIEMPGHAQAALAAYPQFGVIHKRPAVSTDWGVHAYLYNVDEGTFRFLDEVLDEVTAIFPSTYIGVGGDEALKTQWKASAPIQARMRELGIANEDGLQSWFIKRIEEHLDARHRKLVGWDEILEGGLPPQATVMSWRGIKGAIAAAGQGHDVVLAPSPSLYLDDLQSDAHDEPPGRPPVVSLKDVYDFNPMPAEIGQEQASHVLGAQINLWTEYMPTAARDEHAIFPRMAALAEITWSPAAARNWTGFLARLPAQLARYRTLGIRYADSAFAPNFVLASAPAGKISVSLSTQTGSGIIHYSTDGSAPTAASARYSEPLLLTPPVRVQTASFAADGYRLAAARTQLIDAAALTTVDSDQLDTCSGKLVLRIEAARPLAGLRPVHKVDIMDTCWQWKAAPLDGMRQLVVTLDYLPWNYQLGGDIAGVVVRPTTGQNDALDVYLDSCNGAPIAQLPLLKVAAERTKVAATIPALQGQHTLCFVVTGDPKQGLWAVDQVQLMH